MEITVRGIKISYARYDGDGVPVLLLHGWGASKKAMQCLFDFIKSIGRSVISLDFPYFGESDAPPSDWGVYDYANITREFMLALGVGKAVILGHSFGGRVGIILAADFDMAEKLVLVDSAGLKPRRGIRYKTKVLCYKIKKKLKLVKKGAGSADYNALPEFMKPVFVRVVNTHLDKTLKNISVPTLIVWGRNDKDTPMYMAKKFEKKIKDSGLVVLENAGHFSYADKYPVVCSVLKAFV